MLAKAVPEIPPGCIYEPKFDGFRAIVFKDRDRIRIESRNQRPLERYFPELVQGLGARLPDRCVLDGEIVIAGAAGLDFEALQLRLHPAASRVALLASQIPSSYIAFDLLALEDESLLAASFSARRAALEKVLEGSGPPVFLAPSTDSEQLAREWFSLFEGAGLDGIIAKPPGLAYLPGKRAMFKIKHQRTADVVVGGFRWHRAAQGIGSLLLGLYESGYLIPVGAAASFDASMRNRLAAELEPYRIEPGTSHPWAPDGSFKTMPGEASRWSAGKDASWEPLRPELVAEVAYDHMEGPRFRHVTHFLRWRPDRDPLSCTMEQLEQPVAFDLAKVLGAG